MWPVGAEILREFMLEAVDRADPRVGYRDVTQITIEGKTWAISGGMSWGDLPTEAMPYLNVLDMFGPLWED